MVTFKLGSEWSSDQQNNKINNNYNKREAEEMRTNEAGCALGKRSKGGGEETGGAAKEPESELQ